MTFKDGEHIPERFFEALDALSDRKGEKYALCASDVTRALSGIAGLVYVIQPTGDALTVFNKIAESVQHLAFALDIETDDILMLLKLHRHDLDDAITVISKRGNK